MHDGVIRWYHLVLGHAGILRLRDSILSRFHHINLCHWIDTFWCLDCQRYKLPGQGLGELSPCEANLVAWEEVAVDVIGSWEKNNVFLVVITV
jgi:hypothetical protein